MDLKFKIWLLFDAFTHRQSHAMNNEQTQIAILSIRKEPERYFIWTPTWAEWLDLTDFLKQQDCPFIAEPRTPNESTVITEDVTKLRGLPQETMSSISASIPKSPKDEKIDYGYYHKDVHGDDMSLSKINKLKPLGQKNENSETELDDSSERRRSTRHILNIQILLLSRNGKSFKANTKNISLTGALLDREVPVDFLKMPFDLVILNNSAHGTQKSKLHFKGKVVGDLDERNRLTFVDQDPENHKVFKEMLESQSQQKL